MDSAIGIGASHLQILVPVILIASALVIPIISRLNPKYREPLVLLVTVAGFTASLAILTKVLASPTGYIEYLTGYHWGGKSQLQTGQPIGIALRTDLFGAILLILINGIGFLASLYSCRYIHHEVPKEKHTYYYTLLLLMLAGMSGIAITGDCFNFYVFFEIASISSYTLVSISGRPESLEATFKYILTGALSSILIVFAIGLLFNATGTLNMNYASQQIAKIVGSHPGSPLSPYRYLVYASLGLFIMGFSIKAAFFPSHAWLADAHPAAPASISALLSGLIVKTTGVFLLIRFVFTVFGIHKGYYGEIISPLFLIISSITILSGSLFAIVQTQLKRMLAYSTIAQMGYILFGIALITPYGLAGSILHIVNHAIVKSLMFLCSGIILYKTGIRNITDMGKLGYRMPATMACFTIGACSLVGIPPMCGFMSKWVLATATIQAGMPWLLIVLLVSSLLNAVYYFRVVAISYFGNPKIEIETVDEASKTMLIPVCILAVLVIILGVLVKYPYHGAALPAARLLLR
ncbi:MAG: proton-conducting transporter membrane subunit [bacterium]